jgi:hypothetical protein
MIRCLSLIVVRLSVAVETDRASATGELKNNRSMASWSTTPLPNINGLTEFYGAVFQTCGYALMVAPAVKRSGYFALA